VCRASLSRTKAHAERATPARTSFRRGVGAEATGRRGNEPRRSAEWGGST
jgi:hypothetical protein